jgi:heterodisulfide reductase subunit C2
MKTRESECLQLNELDQTFCEEIASLPGGENIKKCFACGTCTAGCPVAAVEQSYSPRKIIRQILFGMREELLRSPEIWYCQVCYRCSARCPQQVNFPDIMGVLRYLAVKYNYVSGDMLVQGSEVDTLSQEMRRDMIKETIDGRKQIIEEIKARVQKAT